MKFWNALLLVGALAALCGMGALISSAQDAPAKNAVTVSGLSSDNEVALGAVAAITQETKVSLSVIIALCGLTATVIASAFMQRQAFSSLSQSVKDHHERSDLHRSAEEVRAGYVTTESCRDRHEVIMRDLARIEATLARIEIK